MHIVLLVAWLFAASISRFIFTYEHTSKYFDYHWVGGVTNTTAAIRITIVPSTYEKVFLRHNAQLEFKLEGRDEALIVELQEAQLAYHVDLNDLKPGTEYSFTYSLRKPSAGDAEGEEVPLELETKSGHFRTFETDPAIFKFSATSASDAMSESTAFEGLVSNKPDVLVWLGNMHNSNDNYLTSGMLQEASHEVFMSSARRTLYQNHALAYLLDSRKVDQAEGDKEDTSISEVNKAYRAIVPHYPLPETTLATNMSTGMWYSFMGGKTKFLVTDSRSFLFTKRLDGAQTVFGDFQLDWIKQELRSAAEDSNVHGVVLLLSFAWKSQAEFVNKVTLHEKHELSELIISLGFNTEQLRKFFVVVSGGMNTLAYDSGMYNGYGNFPVFSCGAIDSLPSCKSGGWSETPGVQRGQYCHFEVRKQSPSRSCLAFSGFQHDTKVMSFDTCSEDFYNAWTSHSEKWNQVTDLTLPIKLRNDPAGETKLEFVKSWPSGGSSFSTMEWTTMVANGAMTKADQEDITSMIGGIDLLLNMSGEQCPNYDPKAFANMPMKVYAYLVLGMLLYGTARSIKVLGIRLIE